jgi:hypothetical protein
VVTFQVSTTAEETPTQKNWWVTIAKTLMSLVGIGAAMVMLWHTDFHAVRTFGAWLVLTVALEGVRVCSEAVATRMLHGDAVKVPWWPLLRAHMVGYAVAMTVPAGRAVAEGAKSYMLAPWTQGPRAAATGVANQSLVLASTGSIALLWSLPSFLLGLNKLAVTSLIQGIVLISMGLGLVAVARSAKLHAWASERYPQAVARIDGARTLIAPESYVRAWGFFLVHRGTQTVQILILMGALGHWSVMRAMAMAGAMIVGVSVGVAVPGQLGAVGGALVMVGPLVGVAGEQALAIALVLHAGQFVWIIVGFVVSALMRVSRTTT